jgi:hypothetical protein
VRETWKGKRRGEGPSGRGEGPSLQRHGKTASRGLGRASPANRAVRRAALLAAYLLRMTPCSSSCAVTPPLIRIWKQRDKGGKQSTPAGVAVTMSTA